MSTEEDFWDNRFHACAWMAYLEVWSVTGQFPPDSEATRQRAYRLYEEALAEKNRRITDQSGTSLHPSFDKRLGRR